MTRSRTPHDNLTHKILVRAREIIADPTHWTKGVMARDKDGSETISARDPEACAFCSLGAIERAAHEFEAQGALGTGGAESTAYVRLNRVILRTQNTPYVSVFNDHPDTGHWDVLDAFKLAIAESAPGSGS